METLCLQLSQALDASDEFLGNLQGFIMPSELNEPRYQRRANQIPLEALDSAH